MSYATRATETVSNRQTTIRVRALAALTDAGADSETMKATVLREYYRQQSSVSLEDVLELNTVVTAPEQGPLEERVATVLTEAIAQHDSWTDTPQAPPASENTSESVTEVH
jgi:mannitol-specific phosphotransferase system IIBC component